MRSKLFQEKYKRLEDSVNFRKVDRLPCADWVQNQDVIEHYSYKSNKKNYWNVEQAYIMAEKCLDLNLEFTPAYTHDVYFPTPQDLYGIFNYEEAKNSMKVKEIKDDSWVVEDGDGYTWQYIFWTRWAIKQPFNDYDGALRMLIKKTEEIRYYTKNVNWQEYSQNFAKDMENNINISSTPQIFLTPFGGLGFDILYLLIGWEYLTDMLYSEDLKHVKNYVNSCTELALKWVQYAVKKEFCPVSMIYSDIAYKKGLMISPVMLEDILGESIHMLTEAYHKKDIKVIYHTEGNIESFINVLIKYGVDGINPLEPYSDMEIVKIRRKFPGLILYGGVDDSNILTYGTPEDVEAEVKRITREIGSESGILLGSSGEIHPACKAENVAAMVEAIKNAKV